MLNSLVNIWWGVSIYYSMANEHFPADVFWCSLAAFVLCLGIVQIVYFFIFPGLNSEILDKPIGGNGKAMTIQELLTMFREVSEKEKNLTNAGCVEK